MGSEPSIAAAAPPRVLVVDDDRNLTDVVERYLSREGFEVEVVHDGLDGLARALQWLPDLVVLDLMLPRLDGVELFRRLRHVAPVPVVMLTARGSEEERVTGLELGADDYVAKPFSPRELTARVRAVLRRAAGPVDAPAGPVLRAGDLEVDLAAVRLRPEVRGSVLVVRDECGGIPDDDLDRIFDVAFRGDMSRSRDTGGGGLGLAIAKGLLEARAGSISVRNRPGGCEFTVRLPVEAGA